jgi:predicted nucleotidyltransferase
MIAFGIKDSSLEILTSIFSNYNQVEEVVLYGSRAKGNFSDRSDVDMVICNSNINRHILGSILTDINNSNFPYTIDIQLLENIKSNSLLEHINRIGQTFYKKEFK